MRDRAPKRNRQSRRARGRAGAVDRGREEVVTVLMPSTVLESMT
ncbi:hypothetical protein GCM10010501_08430 [Streptomyces libani subsp. rufus]|nr:hypothetical protein GCM10010501_08430 [Streptomyces libani subsp. rufus]